MGGGTLPEPCAAAEAGAGAGAGLPARAAPEFVFAFTFEIEGRLDPGLELELVPGCKSDGLLERVAIEFLLEEIVTESRLFPRIPFTDARES